MARKPFTSAKGKRTKGETPRPSSGYKPAERKEFTGFRAENIPDDNAFTVKHTTGPVGKVPRPVGPVQMPTYKSTDSLGVLANEEPRDATFKDLTWNSMKQGYYNSRLGEESYQAMVGNRNEREKYKSILEGEDYQFKPDGWFENAVSGTVGLFGQQVRQLTNPKALAAATGAAAGASLLGKAGPQVAFPEEFITVPAAFMKGLGVGSAVSNYEIEAGFSYDELLENGVSEPLAKKIATAVGVGNAALEGLQVDEMAKALPILKKYDATEGVANAIGKILVDKGLSVGNETLQEIAQEAVTIAGTEYGTYKERGKPAYDAREVFGRLGDTAVSSALSFGLMNAPSAINNAAWAVSQDRYARQEQPQAEEPVEQPSPVEQAAQQTATLEQAAQEMQDGTDNVGSMEDALTQAIGGGKRVGYADLSEEQLDAWNQNHPDDVWVDAQDNVYQIDPAKHITQRDYNTAGDRKTYAFQFDHPELHSFYAEAAQQLIRDASLSIDTPQDTRIERTPQGKKFVREILDTPSLRDAMDMGLSRNQIIKAAEDLIADKGQENNAAAKRLELVLHEMLTEGYRTAEGETVEPNQQYIQAVEAIPGYQPRQAEELPLFGENEKDLERASLRMAAEREAEQVKQVKTTLGKTGSEVFDKTYDGSELTEFFPAYAAYYNAGVSGRDITGVKTMPGSVVSSKVAAMAYDAGKQDAALSLASEQQAAPSHKVFGRAGSGIGKWSNTPVSVDRATVRGLNKIGKKLGTRIVFTPPTGDNGANGYYRDGTIYIAEDADDPYRVVLSHEATHRMQELSPEQYRAYRDYVINLRAKEDGGTGVDSLIMRYQDIYKRQAGQELDSEAAMDEIVADYTHTLLENDENFRRLVYDDRTVAQKLLDAIKDVIRRIRGAVSGQNADDVNVYGHTVAEMEEATRRWEAMLKSSETAVKESKQENTKVDSDSKPTKFSMKSPVEETKGLIALHNLTEQNLLDTIKLGGFPMPSIAIVKSDMGHSMYGPISIVFGKDTIDPRASSKNKVYGGDAYTPTAPIVDRVVNSGVWNKFVSDSQTLAEKIAGGIFSGEIRSAIRFENGQTSETMDDIIHRMSQNNGVMAAYLADNGGSLSPVMQEKSKTFDNFGNEQLDTFIKNLGEESFIDRYYKYADDNGEITAVIHPSDSEVEEIRSIMKDHWKSKPRLSGKPWPDDMIASRANKIDASRAGKFIRNAWNYYVHGNLGKAEVEVDRYATRDALKDSVNDADVKKWVSDRLSGLLGETGIYNNKDPFTSKGNRRSFNELHWPYTLENIVKAMSTTQEERGGQTFGVSASSLQAVSTPEYKSIKEIKDDSGRLATVEDGKYKAMKDNLDARIMDVIVKVKEANEAHSSNSFEESDIIGTVLMEAASGARTASSIIRKFSSEGYTISETLAKEIQKIYSEAAALPTGYFEAKPRRAVGFDEVLAAVIPGDSDSKLKNTLSERGVTVLEYKPGDEADRLAKVNSVDGARFSLKVDSTGRKLSDDQQKFFKDSKARNELGELLPMYHGTKKGGFTKFRDWSYLTPNKAYAERYTDRSTGETLYHVYANIKKPFDTRIPECREIWDNEFYGSYSRTNLQESGLPDWTDGYDLVDFIEENDYDFDAILLDEGADHDMAGNVVERGISYVVRNPEQIKSVDNLHPTSDPDIRYSLKGSDELMASIPELRKTKSDREILDMLIKRHGEIEQGMQPARTVSMPKKDNEEKKLSKMARSFAESALTPDEMVKEIEKMAVDGKFSYVPVSNDETMQAAQAAIQKDGWQESYNKFRSAAEAGVVSEKTGMMGIALYNQAIKDGRTSDALDVAFWTQYNVRSGARATQAMSMLKKMTPEGKLFIAAKDVSKMNEKPNAKKKVKHAKEIDDAVKTAKDEALKEMENAFTGEQPTQGKPGKPTKRKKPSSKNGTPKDVKSKKRGFATRAEGRDDRYETAKRLIRDIHKAIDKRDHGVPAKDWVSEIGATMAKRISERVEPPAKKPTLISQSITGDLMKFAERYLPKAPKQSQRTAYQRLSDYMQNRRQYAQAWNKAVRDLREQYKGNTAAMEALEDFMQGTIDFNANGNDSVMMRAVMDAALEADVDLKTMARNAKLGDWEVIEDRIYNRLAEAVDADEAGKIQLRDAVSRFVQEHIESDDPKKFDRGIERGIRDELKGLGVKVADLIRQNKQSKSRLGTKVADMLAQEYGISKENSLIAASYIMSIYNDMIEESSNKALKAMFKEHPAVNKRTFQERFDELINLGAFHSSAYAAAASKRLLGEDVVISPFLADAYMEAKNDEQRDAIMEEIWKDVAAQVPASWMDKWTALRYTGMLSSIPTHFRNIGGNAFFTPVVLTKDLAATAIESAVRLVSRGKFQGTKGVLYGSKNDRALLKAGWDDYKNVADIISGEQKYKDSANPNSKIEKYRRIYEHDFFENLRKASGDLLNFEDVWFSKPHYALALAQYCKAHGLAPGQISDQARAYAILEAQKATYRDTNAFSEVFSSLGRNTRYKDNPVADAVGILSEGTAPFRKTPANVTVRAVEYSPIGLFKTISVDLHKVMKKKMSAEAFIDNLAAGLTGTALVKIGIYFAAQCLVRGHGSDDDDENRFERLMGHQDYSLELPDGTSVTLNWLAPEAIPFFMGVNYYETKKNSGRPTTLGDMMRAASSITEPLLSMSCLKGINDVFKAVKYADKNGIDELPAAVAAAATSYLTQGLPTILGQVERTFDTTRRTTYTEPGKFLPETMQKAIGKASARFPGLDYRQIPYIDAWGRTETEPSFAKRLRDNMVNPAFMSEVNESPMEKELLRLYRETGDRRVLPEYADKDIKYDGKTIYLDADQYVTYAKEKGQRAYNGLTELVKSSAYRNADPVEKTEMVGDVYTYADQMARREAVGIPTTGWVATAEEAEKKYKISPEAFMQMRYAKSSIEGIKDSDGDTIANSKSLRVMQIIYNTPGLSEKQRNAMFDYFNVGKKVRHYNKAKVNEELKKMERR